MDGRYSDMHVRFLQVMIDRTVVTKKECYDIIENICKSQQVNFTRSQIRAFLTTVNSQISPFNLRLKKGKSEKDGSPSYVLVTVVSNDLNKLLVGGDFTRVDLEYFESFIELICTGTDQDALGFVNSIEALNLADQVTLKITKAAAKDLLDKLVEEKYLEEENGLFSLSVRTILELEQYIVDHYSDVVSICKQCSVLVLCGIGCHSCHNRFHNYCGVKYLKTYEEKNMELKCLSCHTPWSARLVSTVKRLYGTVYDEKDRFEADSQSQGDGVISSSKSSARKRKR